MRLGLPSWFLVLLLCAAVAYFAHLDVIESRPVNPGAAPHSLVSIPYQTHYRVQGAEDGPVVVLVHGIFGSLASFDEVFQEGFEQYRVISFDLSGRGWSEAAPGPHTVELYCAQLTQLLFKLQLGDERGIHLVALSLGAPIAAKFTALYPERVASLHLLSPAGFHNPSKPLTAKAIHVPILGPLLFRFIIPKMLEQFSVEQFSVDVRYEEYKQQLHAYAAHKRKSSEVSAAFRTAAYACVRDFVLDDTSDYAAIGSMSGLHVSTILGTRDIVVPYAKVSGMVSKLIPQASVSTLADASHYSFLTFAMEIRNLLLKELSRATAASPQ